VLEGRVAEEGGAGEKGTKDREGSNLSKCQTGKKSPCSNVGEDEGWGERTGTFGTVTVFRDHETGRSCWTEHQKEALSWEGGRGGQEREKKQQV